MKRVLFSLALLSTTSLIIPGCMTPTEQEVTTPVEEFTGTYLEETDITPEAKALIQKLHPKLPRDGMTPLSSGISHEIKSIESEVLTSEGWTQSGEISRYFDKATQTRTAKVKGYAHIYTFSGFGVTLTSNDPYEDDFYIKQPEEIFLRYKTNDFDVIAQRGNKFIIQRFRKDKNSTFNAELLSKKHSFSGCTISKYEHRESERDLMKSIKNYEIYNMREKNGEPCDRFGNNDVFFVFSPKNPDNYYKISWQDGCAPTCGIPGALKIN